MGKGEGATEYDKRTAGEPSHANAMPLACQVEVCYNPGKDIGRRLEAASTSCGCQLHGVAPNSEPYEEESFLPSVVMVTLL